MTRKIGKWAFIRRSVLVLTATAATGCAQHTWAPGPYAVGDFGMVSGRCKLMAMSGQTSGYVAASGSPKFVAASVGAGVAAGVIGNAIRQQNIYNACMEANGFVAVDGAPAQVAAVAPAAGAPPATAAAPAPAAAPVIATAPAAVVAPPVPFGAEVVDYPGPPRGVIVRQVFAGGAAGRAGIKPGDVIVSARGQPIWDYSRLQDAIDIARTGNQGVPIGIVRNGQTLSLTVLTF